LQRKSESQQLMTAVSDLDKEIDEGFLSVKDTHGELTEVMNDEEALSEENLNAIVELESGVNFKGAIGAGFKIYDRIVTSVG